MPPCIKTCLMNKWTGPNLPSNGSKCSRHPLAPIHTWLLPWPPECLHLPCIHRRHPFLCLQLCLTSLCHHQLEACHHPGHLHKGGAIGQDHHRPLGWSGKENPGTHPWGLRPKGFLRGEWVLLRTQPLPCPRWASRKRRLSTMATSPQPSRSLHRATTTTMAAELNSTPSTHPHHHSWTTTQTRGTLTTSTGAWGQIRVHHRS